MSNTIKNTEQNTLNIAGKSYTSRLLIGTGKYKSTEQARRIIKESGAQIITIAIRRKKIEQTSDPANLLEIIDTEKYTPLPNTAGCYDADSAIRTCLLARELLNGHKLIKLEVIGDKKTLFPDIPETILATKTLIKEGFDVMVYTNDDPVMAKRFEDMGCTAVMPLAAPIGSGMGIRNPHNIKLITDNASVPVIVDAGVGTASDATIAMELGCDGILMNTAIAEAKDPLLMARSMNKAVIAGREAFLAGRMPRRAFASASSPITDILS